MPAAGAHWKVGTYGGRWFPFLDVSSLGLRLSIRSNACSASAEASLRSVSLGPQHERHVHSMASSASHSGGTASRRGNDIRSASFFLHDVAPASIPRHQSL